MGEFQTLKIVHLIYIKYVFNFFNTHYDFTAAEQFSSDINIKGWAFLKYICKVTFACICTLR